jgi:hypothetical protein
MSDALKRAERCRDLARECRRLAAISSSTDIEIAISGWRSITAHWRRPRRLRTLACPVSYFASLKPNEDGSEHVLFSILAISA